MKNIFLLLVCLFCVNIFAQELRTKIGEPILPEEGDWSIGTTAHPIINFVSNIFTNTSSDIETSVPSFGDDLYFYMKK